MGYGTVREDDSESGDAWNYFYEYVHGDNGVGLGTSHQTEWTGMIARSMHLFATTTLQQVLELGKEAAVAEVASPRRA